MNHHKFLSKEEFKLIKPWLFLSLAIIAFLMVAYNISWIWNMVMVVLDLFHPLILAIGFAYVLNIPMMFIERNLKKRVSKKSFMYRKARGISLVLTLLLAMIVMSVIGSIIFPKIIESIIQLFNNMGSLLEDAFENIDSILAYLHIDYRLEDVKQLDKLIHMPWNDILNNALKVVGSGAGNILNNAMSFTSTFFLWFMAFMFSLYLLSGKETLLRQFREILLALFGEKHAKSIFSYGKRANLIFKNFIAGQLLEACILGTIYYIGMRLFHFPFPELIAVIIGVFSLIPVFGPMCAMAVGAFLILSQDFLSALWFIVFFQILSQIEDNFIYPRVVGNSVGLPGLWVILSIFVLGDVFGIVGMVLAVPLTAFAYTILKEFVYKVLKQKKLKVDFEGNIIKTDEN